MTRSAKTVAAVACIAMFLSVHGFSQTMSTFAGLNTTVRGENPSRPLPMSPSPSERSNTAST